MLEGLRIKEICIQIVKRNNVFRLESEFYNADCMNYKNVVKGNEAIEFSQYGTSNELNERMSGYPVLRLNEFNLSFISEPAKFCDLLDTDTFLSLKLKKDDVLICRTNGNPKLVGKSAIVPTDYDYAFASYLFRVRPNKNIINSPTLVAFLNSRFGRMEIERYAMVGNQANFSPAKFREISIPILPKDAQQRIENYTYLSFDALEKSKQLYTSAESYLLECLGMADFAANPDAYNIKTLKESFLETGRFDSEYYLPKYEDYIELVHSYPNGYDLIGNVCDIKDNNYTPVNGIQYKYIELANIGKSGEITGCNEQAGDELPTRARRIVHKGDVIVSSIEGSLDGCALVTDEYDRALCSTGFYVLKSHQHNPETLLTLFKSLPIQNLMKKGCSGTILTAIGKSEFEKIPIPLIHQEVQDEIAKHVKKSFELRMEAMQLLENAKLTVETIIENGGGNLLIYNKLQFSALEEWNQAVWLLFTEIGITSNIDVKAPIGSTYKKLSNSFLKSGRLDAEYYQPKYDHLFSELKRFKTKTIRQIATLSKSIEPGSDAYCEKGIPFIRVADLSKFGLSEPAIYLNKLEFKDTIRPQKDTILLSKDGSVGIAYKVEEPIDVITSGAIIHLNITDKDVLPDYLTLVLNSFVVKLQAERDAGGSIIQHWKPSEIEDVIIPILPPSEQVTISKMLQQSFTLRKESKRLLQEAIQIVETAIEEN